jgi:hypothetical protein
MIRRAEALGYCYEGRLRGLFQPDGWWMIV